MGFLRQIKPEKKVTIGFLGAMAVIVLFYLFILFPVSFDCKNKRNDKIAKSSKLEHAKNCKKGLAAVEKELQQWQEKLNSFVVVDANLTSGVVFEVRRIANEIGVSDFACNTDSGGKDSSKINESRIRVSFISSFVQFAKFINSLERHKPVIFVDSFNISNTEDGRQNVQMSLAFLVRK